MRSVPSQHHTAPQQHHIAPQCTQPTLGTVPLCATPLSVCSIITAVVRRATHITFFCYVVQVEISGYTHAHRTISIHMHTYKHTHTQVSTRQYQTRRAVVAHTLVYPARVPQRTVRIQSSCTVFTLILFPISPFGSIFRSSLHCAVFTVAITFTFIHNRHLASISLTLSATPL
jgi:hypothetical protein